MSGIPTASRCFGDKPLIDTDMLNRYGLWNYDVVCVLDVHYYVHTVATIK